jgi:pimeloyl-ACP methyl ester carboxylesterase
VKYELYEDARRYDAMHAQVPMPTLAFQGRYDDVVDPSTVEQWAAERSNVDLRLLDDGHQLAASLPLLAESICEFVT